MSSAAFPLALLLALVPQPRRPQQADGEARLDRGLRELTLPARGAAALDELVAAGEPAAARALETYPGADLEGRRARALVVREVGGAAEIGAALELLDEPDQSVRVLIAEFLSVPTLGTDRAAERAEALGRRMEEESVDEVRGALLRSLARVDDARAAEVLDGLIDRLVAPWRARAAAALGAHAHAAAGARVVERVLAGFEPRAGERRTPGDVLAVLLGGSYGASLAELPAGGSDPRDLSPFVLGPLHPDSRVHSASDRALSAFVARLRFLGEIQRAERALVDLEAAGFDRRRALSLRGRLALQAGTDPDLALAVAGRLSESLKARPDLASLRFYIEALLLEIAAHFSLQRPEDARAVLDRAAAELDRTIARRDDLRSVEHVDFHVEALERRALVELYRALALLWESSDVSRPAVLAHARRAHELSLRAQLVTTRTWSRRQDAGMPPLWSLDSTIDDPLSPWALVFGNDRHPHMPPARALELQARLLSALASVAPFEVPGFERAPSVDPAVVDARRDPARSALLRQILEAHVDALDELADRTESAERAMLLRGMAAQLRREGPVQEQAEWTVHLQRRLPSDAALPLAEELRAEGRLDPAQALMERLQADLAAAGELLQGLWGEELVARAEVTLGSIHMDRGQARVAEGLFQRALDRLDTLQSDLENRGIDASGLAPLRARQADVLISLAVNANVKLRDPERALGYFERAYRLRDADDFMRVLLACYRARAGRELEARAVLRELPVSPYNYYNLACTHALLGDTELALDFLRRDFAEMRSSPGQLERQKEWAAGDPDLASMRDDARFQALVAPTEEQR